LILRENEILGGRVFMKILINKRGEKGYLIDKIKDHIILTKYLLASSKEYHSFLILSPQCFKKMLLLSHMLENAVPI